MEMSRCILRNMRDVENAILQIYDLKVDYGGIMTLDQAKPYLLSINEFIVILTLNSHEKRKIGHYIVCYRINQNEIVFFDSMGHDPMFYGLGSFLINNAIKTYTYSNAAIQSKNSACCSYFCLYYIFKCFVKGISFKHFLNSFNHSTTLANERIVYDYVKNVYCF